jgi:hypothetical protein
VHRGDALAEDQANRLPAQLLDVDLQASKEQQRRLIERVP